MDENLPKPNIKEQIQTAPPAKKPMPKALIALGIALLAVVMLLIVFAILRNQAAQKMKENTQSEALVPKGTVLFTQELVELDAKGEGSVDITTSTGGNHVGGIVLSIRYNPKLLTNVKIENIKDYNSAFSQSLVPVGTPLYDTNNGSVLLSLQLPPQSPMSGKGVIARLYFKKSNLNIAVNSTQITFLPNTNFITVVQGLIPLAKNQVTVSF